MKTKVKKPSVITDTFEQVAETGLGAVKKAPKAVAQTFNPVTNLPESHGAGQNEAVQKAHKEFGEKTGNHTPLDFDQLQKQYEVQDKQKQDDLRHRLFKLVKEGEENTYEMKKKKEEEKKYQEQKAEQEKQNKEEDQKRRTSDSSLPKGKRKKGLFSPKKKAEEQHTEYRPSSSKG